MAKVPWTYEAAPAAADATGLEGYVVETASGEAAGKVSLLLARDGDLYLVVERGTPPVAHDLRVLPWRDVAGVEHGALLVRLGVDDLEGALELDPANAVEAERAEAVRVTDLPPELRPEPAEPGEGPVDRPFYVVPFGFAVLALLALLALFVAELSAEFTWEFALFAIPAVLLLLAGASWYRLVREPYERR